MWQGIEKGCMLGVRTLGRDREEDAHDADLFLVAESGNIVVPWRGFDGRRVSFTILRLVLFSRAGIALS